MSVKVTDTFVTQFQQTAEKMRLLSVHMDFLLAINKESNVDKLIPNHYVTVKFFLSKVKFIKEKRLRMLIKDLNLHVIKKKTMVNGNHQMYFDPSKIIEVFEKNKISRFSKPQYLYFCERNTNDWIKSILKTLSCSPSK